MANCRMAATAITSQTRGESRTPDAAEAETFVQALIERKELSKLAEFWVSGREDRLALTPQGRRVPRRISAPTYPLRGNVIGSPASKEESMAVRPRRFYKGALINALARKKSKQVCRLSFRCGIRARLETGKRIVLPESTRILLLGSDRNSTRLGPEVLPELRAYGVGLAVQRRRH